MVICDGVIPAQDYKYLYDAGAVAIFGPGSSVAAAGKKILEVLIKAYKEDSFYSTGDFESPAELQDIKAASERKRFFCQTERSYPVFFQIYCIQYFCNFV